MKKHYAVLPLAALAFAACSDMSTEPAPTASPLEGGPSFAVVAGAAFTTDNPAMDNPRGCLHGNLSTGLPAVNCNLYESKPKVWINGGPRRVGPSALTPGDYFFAILEPGGQGGNQNPNDGTDKNLSDTDPKGGSSTAGCDTGTGCGDAYTNRMFRVGANGDIVQFLGSGHRTSTAFQSTHGLMIAPYYFDDTSNNGGVYILAICRLGDAGGSYAYPVEPRDCKYDAFKVRRGDGGGGEGDELDAIITIRQDAINGVDKPHTFDVTLFVFGGKKPYTVDYIDATVTPSGALVSTTCSNGTDKINEVGDDGDTFECTVTVNSSSVGVVEVSAEAKVTDDNDDFVEVSTGADNEPNSPNGFKYYVDASIGIDPLTDTNGITEQHKWTIKLTANTTAGISYTFGAITPSLTSVPAGAAHTVDKNTCATPTVNGDEATCDFWITSSVAAVYTLNAAGSVTFGGVETVNRDTDPSTITPRGPVGTGPATKTYVDGSLDWLKHDQDGKLLGGAKFEVCRTSDYASGPQESFTPIVNEANYVCFEVLDNDAKDTDKANGQFKVEGLVLGNYRVKETAAPSSDYAMDPNAQVTPNDMLSVSKPHHSFASTPFVNRYRFQGETATGAGYSWATVTGGTSNWFMFSPLNKTTFSKFALLPGGTIALVQPTDGAQVVALIAGQQHIVGTVTMDASRNMTITLNSSARFAGVPGNVKVEPMSDCKPKTYIQPGAFRVHRPGSGSSIQILTSSLSGSVRTAWTAAKCYGIHVDVEREIIPLVLP